MSIENLMSHHRLLELRAAKRQEIIISTLESGGVHTADELAEICNVSMRTIYRDIARLKCKSKRINGDAGFGYMITSRIYIDGIEVPDDVFEIAQESAFEWYGGRHPDVLSVRNMTMRIAKAIMAYKKSKELAS